MASLHRPNLASQGTALKALFTGYLIVIAVGYLMALVQIQLTHGLADGEYGLSIDDIVYSYYGNRNNSLLENKHCVYHWKTTVTFWCFPLMHRLNFFHR